MRCAFSDSTSAMVSAAITVSLVSPISPNFVRKPSIRVSRSRASSMRWPSWPSSHAMRNCRPLMVTLTWDIASSRLSFAAAQHAADRFDGVVDALRNLAVGGLERARAGGGVIELAGQPRAIGAERVDLIGKRFLAAVGLAPPL